MPGSTSKFGVPLIVMAMLLVFALPHSVSAQPTTVTAYRSQSPVTIDGIVETGEWNDTPMITDPASGITFAIKQNGTGVLFLMIWNVSASYCSNDACFGGIELGYQNNTQPMGSTTTPTTMILASPSFKGGVDEFISTGETTPVSVESLGYATQTYCALNLVANQYTAECYRPFHVTNAAPDEVNISIGSTLELAFAVGEFSQPGLHGASNMDTYVLTITNSTYPSTVATSSSTSATESSQPSTPSTPNVLYYWLELAVIVVGFTLLILIVVLRYQRS